MRAVVVIVCSALVIGSIAALWRGGLMSPYADDSFWTLTTAGRAGVIAITVSGLALVLWIAQKLTPTFAKLPFLAAAILHSVAALAIFAVIYGVSPQVFYSFYQIIFPDLPAQWVISPATALSRLGDAIDLITAPNLSDDIAGLTFWTLIPFAAWCQRR
ncbi:hypothetical protein [Yoonia sp. 208BN28-4]|uniref:hypothetical protein n=1 Tax=Yoonia sp. 208BN28-4 TaxID=3126505 RepID=UPI0030AA7CB8